MTPATTDTTLSDATAPVATPPEMRLSVFRLFIVIAIIAGGAALCARWAVAAFAESKVMDSDTWVAPYVDVTLTPTMHFEDPAEQPSRDAVLGFVVADPTDACIPSWGSYYSLDAASRALDLDRRIVRLRERGGDAIVSFGGLLNDELAINCTDPKKLVAAYQTVIDRYDLTAVDFDIEGEALSNAAANRRRAAAIAELQRANPDLEVWLTLPVAPHGLDAAALSVVDGMLESGVHLAGVNVMTMNYSSSLGTMNVREGNRAALLATFQQLDGAYQRSGTRLTEPEIWKRIGATPMIGQNDVPGEVFTPGDAQALVEFAHEVDLGRISFWSANRDIACGAVVDDARVSNTCSGVDQDPREFARLFAIRDTSRRPAIPENAEMIAQADGQALGLTRDDPRTSPYPIWRSARAYTEGAKVVWQGRVYEAKWWSQGDQPDAPVKQVWETPWRYIGPVLEIDREAITAGIPAADGSHPRWSAEKVYVAGDIVQLDRSVFKARWWTQADLPQVDPDQPYDHPWEYLGEAAPATPVAAEITPIPAPATPVPGNR